MLQPAPQRDEDKEQGRRVKEGDGGDLGPLCHGNHEDDHGVGEGYGGGQHDEHIHVGCFVFQGPVGMGIEVAPTNKLKRGTLE